MLAGLSLTAMVLLGRGLQLQVLDADRWAVRAQDQQRHRLTLPAPRGTIYDRDGVPLATTRDAFRVAVAPRELTDRRAAADRLRDVLGLTGAEAQRAVDRRRRWFVLPDSYDAGVRERLSGVQGLYFERVVERFHPRADLALALLGHVSADGQARGGLEFELDSVLTGKPGLATVRRDARGEPIPGAMLVVREAVAGNDVYLTVDITLQEIAEEALERAMAETGAVGGDVVITTPRTGELLAAASLRTRASVHWRGATEPYEPGSTLKPFLLAALLAERRATLDDSVYAENGSYVQGGRTIRDDHPYGWLTLRDALRYSSNVAMAKMARRLEPPVQYRYLRDFGFGTRTGVPYPSESAGRLRRPRAWSAYSQTSLAMGYEIATTPLQMAMAYGALANGGVLMEPVLVRRIVSREGRIVASFSPEPVRRVLPEETARAVASVLVDVVEEGTGRRAALGTFKVAGKTGTTQRFDGVDYRGGGYMASFAGFFPAADPQLVFLVKLDQPKEPYYGGLAAAPVTRATLEAALAARSTPLDRRAVIASSPGAVHGTPARAGGAERDRAAGAVRYTGVDRVVRAARNDGAACVAGLARDPGATRAAGAARYTGVDRVAGAAHDAGAARPARAPRNAVAGDMPASVRLAASVPTGEAAARTLAAGPFSLALNARASRYAPTVAGGMRAIPNVMGLPLRDAVRRLHAAGFRVQVEGAGPARASSPAAGTPAASGTVVRLHGTGGDDADTARAHQVAGAG